MKTICVVRRTFMVLLLALTLQAPVLAAAQTTFGRIVVFGDSLSDPGNLFALEGGANKPPYMSLGQLLIPDKPYAKGGHHFSNGATWIEQLARQFGLEENTRPAFQVAGTAATNYAVGGARAHEDGINYNLSYQVSTFLNSFGGAAPADVLYVVEFGSNDIRDALTAGNEDAATAILVEAVTNIGNSIGVLHAAGARTFLVCNAPDFSLTPAMISIDKLTPGTGQVAKTISGAHNSLLDYLLGSPVIAGLPGIKIVRLDFFEMLNRIVADHAAYGLSAVDSACVTPGTPPFACQNPDEFLFWDGAHPTKAAHTLISQEAALKLAK